MDLRVLHYFLMVSQEENITRAARLLHITQPTLSRQMMQLERELGVQLLNREQNKVTLTREGVLFQEKAAEMISLSQETKEVLQRQRVLTGHITIGCVASRNTMVLASAIHQFQNRYPQVQFDLISAETEAIQRSVKNGIFDLGLITVMDDTIDKVFTSRPMPLDDVWGVLVREEMTCQNTMRPCELLNNPVILPADKTLRPFLKTWQSVMNSRLNVVGHYSHITCAAEMVKQGIGVAICVRPNASFDDLKFVAFSPAVRTKTALIWKKAARFARAELQQFMSFVCDAF